MKVYLVEDSPLIRERLATMLRAIDGVEIVGESEGPAGALYGIWISHPDVVVLDLQLSGGSGLGVLHELSQFAPSIVPIVLTNYAIPSLRDACLAAGARYFFDKTAEFAKVRETIAALMSDK